jgi:hypothetical protein
VVEHLPLVDGGPLLTSPTREIDYYGVTFDHLVPADDPDPKVMQINVIEIEDDNGAYANEHMAFAVDLAEFVGKKVLAVPRCCQKRKGTQDRARVNSCVEERDQRMREEQEWSRMENRNKLKGFLPMTGKT